MIIGISGSGRKNAITHAAVEMVLQNTELEYEMISLSNKKINGCIGCTGCASNNICVIKDDFLELAEKLKKADAIVFGAPNYYNMLNGLSHAFWERCFCFRHQDRFALAGKLAVAISTSYSANSANDPVLQQLHTFMGANHMSVVSSFCVSGYSQCYTCGYGIDCASGNIVKKHGYLDEVLDCHLPLKFEDNADAMLSAKKAGRLLKNIISNRATQHSS